MREKKEWQNPELIVLVRGRPEEAVLTACKDPTVMVTSPNDMNGLCSGFNYPTACDPCSGLGAS